MSTQQNKEKCSETYWPLLKEQLSSGKVSFNDLELPCSICYDTMGIQDSELAADETGYHHGAVILPCGHMFGYSCFRQAVEASEEDEMNVCCPSCRASVTHSKCGHVHEGQRMPTCLKELNLVASIPKGGHMMESCKHCIVSSYLMALQSYLNLLPANPELQTDLHISIKTRYHLYTSFPRPEFSEEVSVPASVARLFRTIMADHKEIESGESYYHACAEGTWCDEPISDYTVLQCYITGPPPPKPLLFWDYVEYRNLQDMRYGVAPKTLEELRASYDSESYWGWLS
ncbi:uncharacterized protein FTOL_09476 [Fusarium torulosum]|uniref:RING-type domain-containing protein n=1 Tax=Fusarium torulosum TaxID=33205 RepID=A0AAE8SL41_9HYPO|nr:uncharacterized protein FTOL_09476 [Fusarium torulosum]